MTIKRDVTRRNALPTWVPQDARHYLEHTETGQPIRALARAAQVHPSTVLRQIRKVENARDDPLIDAALRSLAVQYARRGEAGQPPQRRAAEGGETASAGTVAAHADAVRPTPTPEMVAGAGPDSGQITAPSSAQVSREASRVLRRMAEGDAVLAMSREMEKAVVVREGPDGEPQRVAVVEREVAQALALMDWITTADTAARIVRYRITGAGRSALKDLLAADENRAQGFSEAASSFAGADEEDGYAARSTIVESPIYGLARRRDAAGTPFLDRELLATGERFREDYELSRMDPRLHARIARLTDGVSAAPRFVAEGSAPERCLGRVEAALFDLGPGLGDVALRACCLLEGMETLEKRMGWSARSAKIVLRIALQRLQRHYFEMTGQFGPKIG